MEVKDADKRMIIAKPIPIKPSFSKLQSLSSYTSSGAINNSLPSSSSQTTVAAIRPKTVRLKPVVSWSTSAAASSEGEASGSAPYFLADPILQPEIRSSVVYKPLAKPVSRRATFLLAEMGKSDRSHPSVIQQMHSQVQHQSQIAHQFRTPVTSDLHRNVGSTMGITQLTDSAKLISQKHDEKQKAMLPTTSGDRPSYDGYNWRKYGQKQVKGSEYPRSYYKCTHPNCPVKKKVERSLDGQIAEIVYKGEHNHPKPQPPKRHSSGVQDYNQAVLVSNDGAGREIGNLLLRNSFGESYEGSEGRMEQHNRVGFSINPSYPGKSPMVFDAAMSGTFTSSLGTTDNSCGLSCGEDGSRRDAEDSEPHIKRRKKEHHPSHEVVPQATREPRIVLQGTTDAEIFGDGFRWRKYGQKVVKGNPYPRSYYRCSSLKCIVRKHVERSLDDPSTFITTYEGKHNHEMPVTRSSNTAASDSISASPSKKSKQ